MEAHVTWAFHHKRIFIAGIGMILLFAMLITRPSTITGHFVAQTYDQKTDLVAEGSAAYALSGTPMTHIQASGTIEGKGEVRIFIQEGIQRKLIYTNARTSSNKITGMASNADGPGIEYKKLEITELQPELPPLERAGNPRDLPSSSSHACIETCILNPTPGSTYKLLVQTEPGTIVHINALHFSTPE